MRSLELRATRAPRQLQFEFVNQPLRLPFSGLAGDAPPPQFCGRDPELEHQARELLRGNGAGRIANEIRVEWSPRLKSCAGRADYRKKLVTLNPHLVRAGLAVNGDEVDRTLRHELAHLLAQFRVKVRHQILPHGKEWRQACIDLGIGDEKRCHNLPFPFVERARRFLYTCPNCKRDFPRVRRIRRAIACLACCRKHNGGNFDSRFRLKLVRPA